MASILKPHPTQPMTYIPDPERSAVVTAVVEKVVRDPKVYANAADLIEAGGLAKEWLALDANEKSVPIESPAAKSFCVMGAFTRAAHDLGHLEGADLTPDQAWMHFTSDVSKALGVGYAVGWSNRQATQEEVVETLRGAAEDLAAA